MFSNSNKQSILVVGIWLLPNAGNKTKVTEKGIFSKEIDLTRAPDKEIHWDFFNIIMVYIRDITGNMRS